MSLSPSQRGQVTSAISQLSLPPFLLGDTSKINSKE
jgi:hypothetical protein